MMNSYRGERSGGRPLYQQTSIRQRRVGDERRLTTFLIDWPDSG